MRLALVGFTFAQPFLFIRAIDYLKQENHDPDKDIGYSLIGATFIIYTGIAVSLSCVILFGSKLTKLADIKCSLSTADLSYHD